MNLNNPSLVLQSLFSIFARFAGVGLNFVVAMLITHNLPTNEAGMIFMLMVMVTGISLFSRLGVEQWIVRDVAGLPEADLQAQQAVHLRSAYKLLGLSSLVFIVFWLLSSQIIKAALFDDQAKLYLIWIAALGILLFNLVMVHSAFMKATHHISESLLIQNALPAISMLIAMLIFWPIFKDAQNYLWIYIFSLAIAAFISFFWIKPWWNKLKKPTLTVQTAREVLEKSLPLAPVSFFAFMMLWADTVMTGLMLKNEDVALYNVAARVSFVSGFFLGALDATIYPRLLKAHKQDPQQLKKIFWQGSLIVAVVLSLVSIILSLIAKPLLGLGFGEVYRQASWVLVILLVSQLIRGLGLTCSFMFIIEEKVKLLNTLLFVALITNIIANLFLIPVYGIEGAATATLLSNLTLTGGVILLFTHQHLLSHYH